MEEATWHSGITECEVMSKAGQAVAARAMSCSSPGARILLLAGKGHNAMMRASRKVTCANERFSCSIWSIPQNSLAICARNWSTRPH